MLTQAEIKQLRQSYIEVGKMVQKYGNNQYHGVLEILLGQIRCIDSDEDMDFKIKYLKESYERLFVGRGCLGEFVIYDRDKNERVILNEKFNKEIKKILKRYGLLSGRIYNINI